MDIFEEFSTKELYVRYAVDEAPDDKDFTMHIHECCEIYFFISDNTEYLVEGARYPLKNGSVLSMRPAESHRARIRDNEIHYGVSAGSAAESSVFEDYSVFYRAYVKRFGCSPKEGYGIDFGSLFNIFKKILDKSKIL